MDMYLKKEIERREICKNGIEYGIKFILFARDLFGM